MEYQKLAYEYRQLSRNKFLEAYNWSGLPQSIQIDFSKSFDFLQKELLEGVIESFVYPLSDIPFDRREQVQLAGVSSRAECRYFLKNLSDTKNISFLGESHQIYYHDELVALYVKNINQVVSLIKVEMEELDDYEIAIHTGDNWSKSNLLPLHYQEFTPISGAGTLALVCLKTDVETRMLAAKLHDVLNMEVVNMEREILRFFQNNKEVYCIACHIEKDADSNYHASLITSNFDNDKSLEYRYFSQSTKFHLVENFLSEFS